MTKDQIKAMTPGQAWEMFVGDQPPADFVACGGDVDTYADESPMCDDLDDAARDTLACRLYEHLVQVTGISGEHHIARSGV